MRLSQLPARRKGITSAGTHMCEGKRCERREHVLENGCGLVRWHGGMLGNEA